MASVVGTYPGISRIVSVTATNVLGPYPGSALVRFLPQSTMPSAYGNLVVGHGSEVAGWVNAVLDQASIRMDSESGHISTATILDRRDYWRRTVISGSYNERNPDGSIISVTQRTVWQLAALCLSAMGETGYTLTLLPNETGDYPQVNWECTNPAVALEELCNERGCSISLNHATNRVVIAKMGTGATLGDADDILSLDEGVDIGKIPAYVSVCGAPIRWQARFRLTPLMIETDGDLVTPGSVSYEPTGGWGVVDPETLSGSGLSGTNLQLAKRSLHRIYRVDAFADGTLSLPGGAGTLNNISQCFPLGNHLLTSHSDPIVGNVRQRPVILGTFARRLDEPDATGNTSACTLLSKRMALHGAQGIVEFEEPIYQVSGGEYLPATLYLETSFSVRANDTNQYVFYVRDLALGGTGIVPVYRPDLVRTIVANYSDCTTVSSTTDNLTTLNNQADVILALTVPNFATRLARTLRYRSIKAVQCDGVNRQVQWRVSVRRGESDGGAETLVAQNVEPFLGALRWAERQRLANLENGRQEGRTLRLAGLILDKNREVKL